MMSNKESKKQVKARNVQIINGAAHEVNIVDTLAKSGFSQAVMWVRFVRDVIVNYLGC